MMNAAMVSALGDELEKIAILGSVGRAVSRGWNYPSGMWKKTLQEGGKHVWEPAERASFMGKGKVTKYLPIGDKTVATGFAAVGAPAALKKEDPYGEGRSRAERIGGLAGSTLGGLAGAGALSGLSFKGNPIKRFPVLRSAVGAIGGSILGERMATSPFRAARARAEMPVLTDEQRSQLMGRVGVV